MTLRLRSERKTRGWTADWVAKRIGVSRRMLTFIEQGERDPSKRVIDKLEDLFNLPQRELLVPDDTSQHESA